MAIDLLNLEPHKVSRDLSGYITYIYGPPKSGKTTTASQMPSPILLAFEVGYNAIPGIIVQDITNWAEMKQAYNQLKKQQVKDKFKTVIVDTIDVAAEMCETYTCNQLGISSLGELGFGKGWKEFKKEFNNVFRGLTQLGYAVFFIGHQKEQTVKDAMGNERIVIRTALGNSVKTFIEGMADIFGYAHQPTVESNSNGMSVLTLRSFDDSISCGGRFKYIAPEIPLSYENLVVALHEAIDKEAAEYDNQFVTDEKIKPIESNTPSFETLMSEFQLIVNSIPGAHDALGTTPEGKIFKSVWSPKIVEIVEKYLGKNKKVSQCTPQQAEMLVLIVDDLRNAVKDAQSGQDKPDTEIKAKDEAVKVNTTPNMIGTL